MRTRRYRRHGPAVLALVLGLCVTAAVSPAGAIERQHHLGLAPALAILSVKDKSTMSVGAGGALHYAYGLTDQWNLAVEASSAVVAASKPQDSEPKNRPAGVDHASVGASYVIDILRWVPYVGVQGGLYRLSGGTLPESLFLPGVSVNAGLDYQFSRSVALGVGARQHLMLGKLETYPSYTMVVLRLEYMWGY